MTASDPDIGFVRVVGGDYGAASDDFVEMHRCQPSVARI